jgi:hypothetical protein
MPQVTRLLHCNEQSSVCEGGHVDEEKAQQAAAAGACNAWSAAAAAAVDDDAAANVILENRVVDHELIYSKLCPTCND